MDCFNVARKAIESQYIGVCDIIEYVKQVNAETKINERAEKVVLKKQPCRVSFSKLSNTKESDTRDAANQEIKLFISPDIVIKQGSKIIVTQEGRTIEYSNSGLPAIYHTHQEIVLILFKGWA